MSEPQRTVELWLANNYAAYTMFMALVDENEDETASETGDLLRAQVEAECGAAGPADSIGVMLIQSALNEVDWTEIVRDERAERALQA